MFTNDFLLNHGYLLTSTRTGPAPQKECDTGTCFAGP
jgi:hypothetical protein